MSEDTFYATVVGEDRIRNFDLLPTVVQTILIDKVEQFVEEMRDLAAANLDERLGTKTGRLTGDSIETEVRVEGRQVKGRLFIEGVPYARIQEEGGTTPAHMIYPVNGKALAFTGALGDKVFALRVFHPGGFIPSKHFMRDARRELGPAISRGLKAALVQGIRENMRIGS
jgi:hypothetical protein